MIQGVHALIYTREPKAVRDFFRKTLKFRSVDAGQGWLLFALPPAELGVHPTESKGSYDLYLMCDDLEKTMAALKKKGVKFAREVTTAAWGRVTAIALPGGVELGLYQPRHPTAIAGKKSGRARRRASRSKA